MPVKFSNSYNAKKKRIKKLPELIDRILSTTRKRDAVRMTEIFHDGIKNDTFNLDRLAGITVRKKIKQGMSKPETPLYGKGDDVPKKTYANMLRIRKLKNGYKVFVSRGIHWSGKIKLYALFLIHEMGAKIALEGGKIIQIPPRPAFLLAHQKLLMELKNNKKETSKEVKEAIMENINKNKNTLIKEMETFTGIKGKDLIE